MKIRFNDGTELQVQSVTAEDNRVEIKTILYSLEQLRAKFEDTFATKKMEVWETAKKLAEYANYIKRESKTWTTAAEHAAIVKELNRITSLEKRGFITIDECMRLLSTAAGDIVENMRIKGDNRA